jgi:hypothetical protein
MARSWTRIHSAGGAGSRAHKPIVKAIRGNALELKRPRLARVVAKCSAITGNYRRFSPPGPGQGHLRPKWTIPANPPQTGNPVAIGHCG